MPEAVMHAAQQEKMFLAARYAAHEIFLKTRNRKELPVVGKVRAILPDRTPLVVYSDMKDQVGSACSMSHNGPKRRFAASHRYVRSRG